MKTSAKLAAGVVAAVLVAGLAVHADAGGIVYWGGNRIITTRTPLVVTDSSGARHVVRHAYRKGYRDGYDDGFHDGVRTEAARTVVTRTHVVAPYVVPTYTAPTVIIRRSPVVYRSIRHRPRVRGLRHGHSWGGLHRHRCHRTSGLRAIFRW